MRVGGSLTWDHSKCASLVRGIQNFHMDGRGWNDIAYNFVVCPHGYTFEGRGLNVVNGANGTNAGNRSSHAICCLAGIDNPFSDAEKHGFRDTVAYIDANTSAPGSAIGHRDHKATACPGDERYHWIHSGMPVSGGGPTPSPTPPPAGGRPTLRLGSRGADVRTVQTIISQKAGGDITVDGVFGPGTERRVKDVQNLFGLPADGIVGPKTWAALDFLAAAQPAPTPTPTPIPVKATIQVGARGELVIYLQSVIANKAGGNISIDGVFGAGTKRRVQDLQRMFGLSADGIVGPQTWAVVDFLAAN